jgi:uncharacterized protein (TIGR02118 family)
MVYLTVMYHPPADPAAFMNYYFATHASLAAKLPGLRSYVVSDSPISFSDGTAAPYALIAHLGFDDAAALRASMASPEGRATAADVAKFATGGVTLLTYDARPL